MKTIGVLGGISPQATMDFERRIHEVSQRTIAQHGVTGYPGLVVYYHRAPPVVSEDGINPVMPLRPDPELLEAARWLGEKADFLVITSNGAHLLREHVERAAGRPVLSMIDQTIAEVGRRGWTRVGLLGFPFAGSAVYAVPLRGLGLACDVIDDDLQERMNAAIVALCEGRDSDDAARDAVDALRARGVDGVIPGCTEIPLLLGDEADAPDLVNPLALLAEAAVAAAREPA